MSATANTPVQTSGQNEPSAADKVVDAWFAETFSGIPLAIEYFNRFRVATEELKKRLAALKE